MKNHILVTFLSILFMIAVSRSSAQELHCYKAIKKTDNACKKDSKIHKKMFHDRPYKADKKLVKSYKKDWKAEGKEFYHDRCPGHVDYYW